MFKRNPLTNLSDATRLMVSPRFVAICMAGAFMLVVGAVLSIQYLFLMSGAILAIPIVGYIVAVRSLGQLSIERTMQPMVEEGEEFEVTLEVHNRGMLPRMGLKLDDRLPEGIELLGRGSDPIAVCSLETQQVTYRAKALRRGAYTIEMVDAVCEDLLGIFKIKTTIKKRDEVLVYPCAAKITPEELLPGFGDDLASRKQSFSHPEASEIHGVREYYAGDDLRRIHWPTSARTGELVVMEFDESPKLQALVVIDNSKDSDEETLDSLTRVARSIADDLMLRGGTVTIGYGDQNAMAVSQAELKVVYTALARIEPEEESAGFVLGDTASMFGTTVVLVSGDRSSEAVKTADKIVRAGCEASAVLVTMPGLKAPGAGKVRGALIELGIKVTEIPFNMCKLEEGE